MESLASDYRTARVTKPLDGSPLLLCTSHIVIVSFWHGELGFLAAVAKARRALRRRSESHPFSDRLCGDLVPRGRCDPDRNNAVVVLALFEAARTHRMASYRCYFLDYRDRIRTFIEIQADTDDTAVERAKEFAKLSRQSFELWRGSIMV